MDIDEIAVVLAFFLVLALTVFVLALDCESPAIQVIETVCRQAAIDAEFYKGV